MKYLIVILSLYLSLNANVTNEICEAYNSKNYSKALTLSEQNCTDKKIEGCNTLGLMYLEGLGVKKNYKKATKIFEKNCFTKAEKASNSCISLAWLYINKLGLRKELNKILDLYKRACNLKNSQGCDYVSQLYGAKRKNPVRNILKGILYLKKGCALGHKKSCATLKKIENKSSFEVFDSNELKVFNSVIGNEIQRLFVGNKKTDLFESLNIKRNDFIPVSSKKIQSDYEKDSILKQLQKRTIKDMDKEYLVVLLTVKELTPYLKKESSCFTGKDYKECNTELHSLISIHSKELKAMKNEFF